MTAGCSNANGNMYNFDTTCSNLPIYGSTAMGTTPTTPSTTTTTTKTNTNRAKQGKNLSSTSLMTSQESLLARGPNFDIVPLYSSKGEYVTAVKKVC